MDRLRTDLGQFWEMKQECFQHGLIKEGDHLKFLIHFLENLAFLAIVQFQES